MGVVGVRFSGYTAGVKPIYLVLHNVRSTHNVGSILRTADGAGVERVYLCGCTPTPVDRFGRKRKDVAKVALGAEETVPWEQCVDTLALIVSLKEQGVRVVAVEQDERSIPYATLSLDQPIALVLGPEVEGLPQEVLDRCDTIVEIPMHGTKESLNVSVAAGVVLYRVVGSRGRG